MRYIGWLILATALAGPVLVCFGLAFAPAPIGAEYWIRQAIAIKRDIAQRHADRPRLIVTAGSSAMFGIDTAALTAALGRPAINMGSHAGLRVEDFTAQVAAVSARGDVVVLALEPGSYCPSAQSAWYARNRIAWLPEAWSEQRLERRVRDLWSLGPWAMLEIGYARLAAGLAPALFRSRLESLDDALTLRRFAARQPPAHFEYSAFNLDDLGNMLRTESSQPYPGGAGVPPEARLRLCDDMREVLTRFVANSARAGVTVYFANAPFMLTQPLPRETIDAAARELEGGLASIAPLLDTRGEVTFGRELFLDTAYHLNAEGRRRRTELLIAALRQRLR